MAEPGILPSPVPFGKYYLLERINVGGMAEVYKAKAFGVEGFERLLAVKKILSTIAEDESFIRMFKDEAMIAGQLHHANIAQIFDLGMEDGSYFIAMEYISGKDLKTIFERGRRLGEKVSIPRVCYLIMNVCDGLSYAHHKKDAQGNDLSIVHRDISPQNLLISYEGDVKVIDFGIAKAQGKTSQTQVGILKGKFSYMSPEQVRGLHVDHRSDLFSLGIVLYELLTLERLFLGESDFDTLEKIRKVEMSPPSLYNPHIPKELEDIVLKALSKTPEERFQTAAEFSEALEQFMRNQGYYYTNKDASSYMKEAFSADIEFEAKKVEYYHSLNLKPIEPGSSNGTPPPSASDPGLSWGAEEVETQIFDRPEEVDEADIVYAADSGSIRPLAEFPSQAQQPFQFPDSQPAGPVLRPPTAQIPVGNQIPRTHTVNRRPPPKEGLSIATILGIALLVVVIGVGAIYAAIPRSAKLLVDSEPKSVEVVINGAVVHDGATPYEFNEVEPGPTTFELRRAGFETFVVKKDVIAGKTYRLEQRLKPVSTKAELFVKSTPPGAAIEIDGKAIGEQTPFTVAGLAPGQHTVRLRKEGYVDESRDVDVDKAGDTIDLRLRPSQVALKVSSEPAGAAFDVFEKSSGKKVGSGTTPHSVSGLAADKTYRVAFSKSGYAPLEDEYAPSFKLEDELLGTLVKKAGSSASSVASVDRPKKTKVEPKTDGGSTTEIVPPPKKEDPKPKVKGTGLLVVGSKPTARVFIDGQDTGRYTPLMNFKIAAGKHKIGLVNKEFGLNKTFYVNVKPGETERLINK